MCAKATGIAERANASCSTNQGKDMRSATLTIVGATALLAGSLASGAKAPERSKQVRLENQSHHSIVSVAYRPLTGPNSDSWISFNMPEAGTPPGDYEILNLGGDGGGCMVHVMLDLDGAKRHHVQLNVNACTAGRWVVLDTVDYVETGGFGKGPVVVHPVPPPLLTEAEIQPCNELLGYRSAMYKENAEQSNLDFALNSPPFEPLYDLQETHEFIAEIAKSIAAVESGSDELQQAIFGQKRFTGQEAVERLATDRRFQCLLQVRLRQLQGKGSRR